MFANLVKRALGFLFVSACMMTSVNASSSTGGYVSDITIGNAGTAWFSYTGTHNGSWPACADPNGLWSIDTSTASGQSILAGLLTASARHQVVSIQGTGACLISHEQVAYVVLTGQ